MTDYKTCATTQVLRHIASIVPDATEEVTEIFQSPSHTISSDCTKQWRGSGIGPDAGRLFHGVHYQFVVLLVRLAALGGRQHL